MSLYGPDVSGQQKPEVGTNDGAEISPWLKPSVFNALGDKSGGGSGGHNGVVSRCDQFKFDKKNR